jgi:hypothetical protein
MVGKARAGKLQQQYSSSSSGKTTQFPADSFLIVADHVWPSADGSKAFGDVIRFQPDSPPTEHSHPVNQRLSLTLRQSHQLRPPLANLNMTRTISCRERYHDCNKVDIPLTDSRERLYHGLRIYDRTT